MTILRHGCTALLLAFSLTAARAQAPAGEEPRALGLRPPTVEEREWMRRNMPPVKEVRINKLGLDRINSARRIKGLPTLTLPTVPDGAEVISNSPTASVGTTASETGGALAAASLGALPGGVDNSALPSFPPIRNQGEIGSCACFATVYYAGTHMLGMARGFDNRNDTVNTTKLSPKWAYPMVNDGGDNGSWFSDIIDLMLRHGAASWQDFPYSGVKSDSRSYLEWSRDATVWRNAINNRFAATGAVPNLHTAAGLDQAKTLLVNGYVLLFATNVYGWQYSNIGNDPTTTADDAFIGKKVCTIVTVNSSGHAMTIVGYNDDIWADVNKNGLVDAGEKGAFRIANSWGTGWNGDGGFTWISYDALRTTSAVAGATNANRAQAPYYAFWDNQVYWITARAAYTPTLLGQFTLNHAKRNELNIQLGRSATSATTPTTLWQGNAIRRTNTGGYSSGQGGPLAFDGSSTPTAGSFVFDLSDVATSGSNRYYLSVTDAVVGSSATISDFKITDAAGTPYSLGTAVGIPGTADNATRYAYLNFSLAAPVINSSTSASGTVGQPFSYTITATGNPTSFGATNLPNGLTVNPTTGVISGTPTAGGSFTTSLSASNAAGSGGATLTVTISVPVTSPPVITSATTASATVGVPFSYAITATNSPLSFGASSLPPGLAVNTTTGVVSGTPTQAGSYNSLLSAANAGATGTRALAITVAPASSSSPAITSSATVTSLAGNPLSYRILATNNPTSFGATGLPSELTLDPATGIISGTPTVARSYAVTISATNASGTGYEALTLNILGDSSFAPSNDSFANRITLAGTSATTTRSNANGTAEAGESAHAGFAAATSVWWTWTAPSGGSVAIDTFGSDFDTVLAVYTGTSVGALSPVASNDNSGGPTSRVTFTAVAGVSYQIAVDGFGASTGSVTLNLALTGGGSGPANDHFTNAATLTGATANATGINVSATSETSEPSHAGNPPARSVWWKWTAPSNGTVTLDTVGSNFDTVLAVYSGTSVSGLTPLASDDQSGGNNTSRLTFAATSGTTYRIAVDGWVGATGNIALHLQLASSSAPLNDAFANRVALTGTSATASGGNIGATAENGESAHAGYAAVKSVWWGWTAPASGTVSISTAGSTFDTILAVYTGSGVASLAPIASNDDSGGQTSTVSFSATGGVSYVIAVDGYSGATGTIALNLTSVGNGVAPANDQFVNAIDLVGAAPSTTGNNLNATTEASEPGLAGYAPRATVWWKWTAPSAGQVTFSTGGSSFDTVLAAFTGSSVGALNLVADNDDAAGSSTSQIIFQAVAGTTYRIAVGGYAGATGTIALAGTLLASDGLLYSTDFEAFSIGAATLTGTDGWLGVSDGGGVQGIINAFGGLGKGAYLGYNIPSSDFVRVYRPVNFDPLVQGSSRVTVAMEMQIVDSDNGARDFFGVSLLNISGDFLAAVVFNNANKKIYRDNGVALTDTARTFSNAVRSRLTITIDFGQNTWSATHGADALFTNVPFHAGGKVLTLGGVHMDWSITNPGSSGNNFLLFDNFSVATSGPSLPVITSAAAATATLNASFIYAITATNSPTSFGTTGLPSGLILNATTGLITGTPITAGEYPATISATNGAGTTQRALTISVVVPLPVITSSATATGRVGQAFSYQIEATNGPTSFGVTASRGSNGLPAGLALNPITGLISGIPTTAGTFTIPITATNAGGTASADLVLTVAPGPTPAGPPVINSPALAAATVGQLFNYPITATNTPTSYGVTAGRGGGGLPAGLTLNETTGLISGTPTTVGTFTISLTATNASGTGSANLGLTIAGGPAPGGAPVITSSTTAAATAGQAFSYQIAATNNPTSFSITASRGGGGLPTGLTLNTATGLISGTPTVTGTFTITLNATNAGGTGSANLGLTIAGGPAPAGAPVITSPTTASATAGQAFSYQITATNNPTGFSITESRAGGGLPSGLILNTTTGLISGTPTVSGSFTIALNATNAGGTGSANLGLTIAGGSATAGAPVITSPASAAATVGQPFNYQITATNSPTSFSITASRGGGGLPSGLTLNTTTGLISGTPTVPGTFTVSLAATNAGGSGGANLGLTIAP